MRGPIVAHARATYDSRVSTSALDELRVYRDHESTLALLHLSVLATLFVLHLAFVDLLGPPRAVLIVVLGALFALHTLVFIGLLRLDTLPPARTRDRVAIATILLTVLGAASASLFGEGSDHHYFVLMLPPIISAAMRFRRLPALTVAGIAAALSLYDVWRWESAHASASPMEYFEVATLGVMFLVVSLVVNTLSAAERREHERARLQQTELLRTRERLFEEERLAVVGRLASAIAHEIRNPVGMIASSLAAAQRGGLDDAARAQMYQVATDESLRLERLTADFLAYARARRPEYRECAVDEVAGAALELARARAHERGVQLELIPSGARATLDPFQIHQALLNLLANAIDATPHGGTVKLRTSKESGCIAFQVTDPGVGIPAESVPSIFEPFVTFKPGGTGLGLAITRRIARSHGGDVLLELNHPGCVTFRLQLPVTSLPAEG